MLFRSLRTETAVPVLGSERGWLLSFAILAGVYRLLIGFTIALFIAGKFFFVGVSLAIWLIISQMCMPLYRMFSGLIEQAQNQSRLGRLCLVTGSGLTLLVLVLFVIPVSDSTHAEGVVNLPENAQIRTRAAGFMQKIYTQNGQRVQAGEPLFEMQNLEQDN